jgi:hypothetical protein
VTSIVALLFLANYWSIVLQTSVHLIWYSCHYFRSSLQQNPNPQPPENTAYQGVRSDSYTNVDIVSPHLQKQIIEGKDINLASLLMHNYECPQKRSISTESLEVQPPWYTVFSSGWGLGMAGVLLYHCCKLKPFTWYSCFSFCCDFNSWVTVSCKLLKHCVNINLASLLMHNYECPQKRSISTESLEVQLSGKPDTRLNRSLSISEFLKSFGKYKRVMTSVYSDRRLGWYPYPLLFVFVSLVTLCQRCCTSLI